MTLIATNEKDLNEVNNILKALHLQTILRCNITKMRSGILFMKIPEYHQSNQRLHMVRMRINGILDLRPI